MGILTAEPLVNATFASIRENDRLVNTANVCTNGREDKPEKELPPYHPRKKKSHFIGVKIEKFEKDPDVDGVAGGGRETRGGASARSTRPSLYV